MHKKKRKDIYIIKEILDKIFKIIFIIFLFLLLIEIIWPKSVTTYLNFDYFAILVILFGIIFLFKGHHKINNKKVNNKINKMKYIYCIFIFIIIDCVLLFFKLNEEPFIKYIIIIFMIFIIFYINYSFLITDKKIIKNKIKENKKNILIFIAIILALLTLFSIFLKINLLRLLLIIIYILFLPGLLIIYLIFPKSYIGQIKLVEKIFLSFALSLATVPIIIFLFNICGIKINKLNIFLIITLIYFIFFIIFFLRKKYNKKCFYDKII